MNTDAIRREVLPVFMEEAREGLATLERCLVELERRPDDSDLIGEIFRAAHTLKGNSSSLGFTAIAEVTHVLEDLLDRMRNRRLDATPALVTLLLESVDLLRILLRRAADGDDTAAPGQAEIILRLRQAGERRAASAVSDRRRREEDAGEVESASSDRFRGIRVGLDKLERLLTLAGEIAIARSRIGALIEKIGAPGKSALDAHREADRLDRDMQELVMRARMVPLGPSFSAHTRLVRDVSMALGKEARLAIQGDDVEADLAVVEQLRDPLTHMIRNALDHGVESAAERLARGKAPFATITLRAFHQAGQLVVQVGDDGAGLDRARILARARERGLVGEAQSLSEREILDLIFRPGFTTAESVTALSGRGVGLDVVRRNIAALRGVVEVESRDGEGTRFTLRLPLTLSLIVGFIVSAGDERYVIPLDNVVECLDLPPGEAHAGDVGVMNLRGEPIPYLRINHVVGGRKRHAVRENVVIVEHGDDLAGIVVDGMLGEAQIVLKPLGHPFQDLNGIAGSTILGDGQVALILDVAALLQEARSGPSLAAARPIS